MTYISYRSEGDEELTDHDPIVVDLGYSSSNNSCGIACENHEPFPATFGETVTFVKERVEEFENPLLILEAPLSTKHGEDGNPQLREEFEEGRGWWYGAGAVTLLSAKRILNQLHKEGEVIHLAEAFLSHKEEPTSDKKDAEIIRTGFADASTELDEGWEVIHPSVDGVPPVYVFD